MKGVGTHAKLSRQRQSNPTHYIIVCTVRLTHERPWQSITCFRVMATTPTHSMGLPFHVINLGVPLLASIYRQITSHHDTQGPPLCNLTAIRGGKASASPFQVLLLIGCGIAGALLSISQADKAHHRSRVSPLPHLPLQLSKSLRTMMTTYKWSPCGRQKKFRSSCLAVLQNVEIGPQLELSQTVKQTKFRTRSMGCTLEGIGDSCISPKAGGMPTATLQVLQPRSLNYTVH